MISTAPHPLHLRIFDQTVSVQTHSAYLRQVVEQMYHRFCVVAPSGQQPTLQFTAMPESSHLTSPNEPQESSEHSIFDVSRFVNAYTANIRTHLIIHAGVLAQDGQGILIVAPSMHGKTTLTLELLRRGFEFLSDEIAALGLEDGKVYPFPRALVIRPGSLTLAGFPPQPPETPTWLGKQIIDAEALRSNCMGAAVPINHIFFLHDGNQTKAAPSPNAITEPTPPKATPSCGLLLSSLPAELLDAIHALPGLESLTVGEMDNQPYLTIYTQDRPTVLKEIDALCLNHNVDLMHLGYRRPHRPDFSGPVELNELPHSEAVMLLLQQFLGGYHSALLQDELGNSPVRLSMTLARMIREANCYQLSVGPLNEMADIICAVTRDS